MRAPGLRGRLKLMDDQHEFKAGLAALSLGPACRRAKAVPRRHRKNRQGYRHGIARRDRRCLALWRRRHHSCHGSDNSVTDLRDADTTPSNVRRKIVIFMIFIHPTFSVAQLLLRLDKINARDPLDHPVAKLVFNAQPQGGAIQFGTPSIVHRPRPEIFSLGLSYTDIGCRLTSRLEFG